MLSVTRVRPVDEGTDGLMRKARCDIYHNPRFDAAQLQHRMRFLAHEANGNRPGSKPAGGNRNIAINLTQIELGLQVTRSRLPDCLMCQQLKW